MKALASLCQASLPSSNIFGLVAPSPHIRLRAASRLLRRVRPGSRLSQLRAQRHRFLSQSVAFCFPFCEDTKVDLRFVVSATGLETCFGEIAIDGDLRYQACEGA